MTHRSISVQSTLHKKLLKHKKRTGGGGRGEPAQKIATRHSMKHLMQEATSFSKINWACAVTLNPFVVFGNWVFGRQLYTSIFEKKKLLTYQYFSFERVHGEARLKMGCVVKKQNNSLLLALILSKCILKVSLYIWLSIYTNNRTLRIIWKFDLSSRGVLGRIYALSIEVLYQSCWTSTSTHLSTLITVLIK